MKKVSAPYGLRGRKLDNRAGHPHDRDVHGDPPVEVIASRAATAKQEEAAGPRSTRNMNINYVGRTECPPVFSLASVDISPVQQ